MFTLRQETARDAAAIEDLLDRCFGPDRRAKTSYRFRDGVEPVRSLCRVADEEGAVVGSIRYWPVLLDGAGALLLGPLAIEPARQSQGVGRALVFSTLAEAEADGFGPVFLVGERAYYERFGFIPASPEAVMPGEKPERLLRFAGRNAALAPVGVLRPCRSTAGPRSARLKSWPALSKFGASGCSSAW